MKREKTFEQKLQAGELYDIRAAAAQLGISERHLRRKCVARTINHIVRGGTRYYFAPQDLLGEFKRIKAVA